MDNTMERLTEILRNGILAAMDDDNRYLYTDVVDYMMAHGVTLDNQVSSSKWIPVTERLPDKDTLVLCVGSKAGMFLGYVRSLYGDDVTAYTIVPNSRSSRYTKYWMPLPEPPKGE